LSELCIAVLVDAATMRRATLIASLHQIDLAVAHFPRLVGLSRGRVVFDRPAVEVDASIQRALYANETAAEAVAFEPRQASAELLDADLAMPVVGRV
jgi:phosphonate transport system ATP-binding protein